MNQNPSNPPDDPDEDDSYFAAANRCAASKVDLPQIIQLAKLLGHDEGGEEIMRAARAQHLSMFECFQAGVLWQRNENREEQLILLRGLPAVNLYTLTREHN